TMPAFSIPRIWWRRSEGNVATEYFLVAEIRDAGADGAGERGFARLRGDPVPDQRNPHRQSRRERAAGVFGLYRSGVQESEILGSRLRCDQSRRPRRADPVREFCLLLPLRLRGSPRRIHRPAGVAGVLRLRPEAASAVSVREEP